MGDLSNGQTSATYVGDRASDKIPPLVSSALLDLHYVCLRQAKASGLLSRSGAILSSMGGRVQLETMLKLADAAGYVGRVLGLSWKEQSEPESVIGGYAAHQEKGLGPVCKLATGFTQSFDYSHNCQFSPCSILTTAVLLLSRFGARTCLPQTFLRRCWALRHSDR